MLDEPTIKVGDVESTIRTRGDVDRMKPRIRRRQELGLRFPAFRPKGGSIRNQDPSVDQIAETFTHECVSGVFGSQRVAAEDVEAAQGIEMLAGFVVEHQRLRGPGNTSPDPREADNPGVPPPRRSSGFGPGNHRE